MGEIFLYHGSAGIIKAPVYEKGNGFNDYGCGFYCTGDKELAKEWACTGGTAAFVNIYELNTEGLRILDLASGYTLLYHIGGFFNYFTQNSGFARKNWGQIHSQLEIFFADRLPE